MKDNRKVLAVLVFLCVGILPAAIALRSAFTLQTPDTKLFVDPPLIFRESLVVGERFSINVSVADVSNLTRYEFKMSFNTVMLDVVGVTLLPEANLPLGNWVISDLLGLVWVNVTYEGPSITTTPPVALASIEFKAMNRGESPLQLYDTALFDRLGSSIAHTTEDGLVTILRHDVAIVDVLSSTHETYVGRLVMVNVVASNEGDVAENFTVRVYHNSTLFGTFDVVNLNPGANLTIVFTWNTSDVAAGNMYALKAEASSVLHESNLTNNVFIDGTVKVKIIGDVNGDNKVNIDDWTAFDAAWGTHEGDPGWNAQADINGDGIVNNDDGILIAQNYRNTA
jgi:hypothetical protein